MAVDIDALHLLLQARRLGVQFTNTLTIGRQSLWISQAAFSRYLRQSSENIDRTAIEGKYAEHLFSYLGAKTVSSIDYSNYENATYIHDLNQPGPSNLDQKFSVVFDGGTVEHVFNFPVAIANCMKMVAHGGHFIGIAMMNNSVGHGFYQLSPETYYRIFDQENGFEVIQMYVCEVDRDSRNPLWFTVKDPKSVQSRVTLTNARETYLMVIAKKIADVPIFRSMPYQSDYVSIWNRAEKSKNEVSTIEYRFIQTAEHTLALLDRLVWRPVLRAHAVVFRTYRRRFFSIERNRT